MSQDNVTIDSMIYLTYETLVVRCLVNCFLSLPINLYIAIIIFSTPHLYKIPRIIFQLNLILCNLISLFVIVLETINSITSYELIFRNLVCIINDLPSRLFYFNLMLALIDRYVANSRSDQWYREKVTVGRVIFSTLILNLALALTWICVGQWALVNYGLSLVLIITCPIFTIILNRTALDAIAEVALDDGISEWTRIEREATTMLIVGTEILLLLPLPLIVFTIFDYLIVCLPTQDAQCIDIFFALVPYLKMIIEIHSIVHPALFLRKNKEFFSSL